MLSTPAVAQSHGTAYRTDIDGLRGLAVLSVVVFHVSSGVLPGGFVGVDVFFVISGYLITGLIMSDVERGRFSFVEFYRRRAARLLPALLVTLLLTGGFALLAYAPDELDRFGKQLFYGALGLANILFARGVNYFADDFASKPLLHLWSLGVEEQFYLVWPTLLLLLCRWRRAVVLGVTLLVTGLSLVWSIHAVQNEPLAAYFLPHLRAFELTIGAAVALVPAARRRRLGGTRAGPLSLLGLGLMIAPMLLLDGRSPFPGLAAAIPCLGAALFLWSEGDAIGNRLLSWRPLVLLGLVSYPFYLLHVPVLSAAHYLGYGEATWLLALLMVALALPGAWLIYRYLELPVRRLAREGRVGSPARGRSTRRVAALVAGIGSMAVLGTAMAKSGGFPQRFEQFNPFAASVYDQSRRAFTQYYRAGAFAGGSDAGVDEEAGSILFFGDSMLQDYLVPFVEATGLGPEDVDMVTKAGCGLLKGMEFESYNNTALCTSLRGRLYELEGPWDTVVLTQGWSGHPRRILNAPADAAPGSIDRWIPFLEATIEHFSTRSNRIVVIGEHVEVSGTQGLSPHLFMSPADYASALSRMQVVNEGRLRRTRSYFDRLDELPDVDVIHPSELWRDAEGSDWRVHDGEGSYFHDHFHLSSRSVPYLARRLREQLTERSVADVRPQGPGWVTVGAAGGAGVPAAVDATTDQVSDSRSP